MCIVASSHVCGPKISAAKTRPLSCSCDSFFVAWVIQMRLSGVICSPGLTELKIAMIHSSPVDVDNLHSRMMQREKQELPLVLCVKSPLETSLRLFVCQRLSIYLLFSIYPINNATISDSIFQTEGFQKVPVSKFRTQEHSLFPTSIMYIHIIHSFRISIRISYVRIALTIRTIVSRSRGKTEPS